MEVKTVVDRWQMNSKIQILLVWEYSAFFCNVPGEFFGGGFKVEGGTLKIRVNWHDVVCVGSGRQWLDCGSGGTTGESECDKDSHLE